MSDEDQPPGFSSKLWNFIFRSKVTIEVKPSDDSVVDALMEMDVSDVMTHRNDVLFFSPYISKQVAYEAISSLCKDAAFSRFIPVCEGDLDAMCGYVDLCDVAAFYISSQEHIDLSEYVKKAIFVPPLTKALELLERFKRGNHSLAVVLDEYGGTEGVVTIDNIIGLFVGAAAVDREAVLEEGKCEISGRSELKVLESRLGMPLTIEGMPADIETIGGLIMFMLGRVPTTGETVVHDTGITFSIMEASAKAIIKVMVERPKDSRV